MKSNKKRNAMFCHDEIMNELFTTQTLVDVAKASCMTREFKGEYYGIPQNYVPMISNERNEYISLFTIISDKLKYAHNLNLNLEQELTILHQNSDYCGR